jgi:hypothetical protein
MQNQRWTVGTPDGAGVPVVAAVLLALSGLVSACVQTQGAGATSGARSVGKEPLVIEDLQPGPHRKQVNLVYYEGGERQSSRTICLSYYDENDRREKRTVLTINDNGIASALLPNGKSGSSAIFRFALTESGLPVARPVRIPAGEYGGNSITLRFNDSMFTINEGAAMELVRFPLDGTDPVGGGDIMLPGSSLTLKYR